MSCHNFEDARIKKRRYHPKTSRLLYPQCNTEIHPGERATDASTEDRSHHHADRASVKGGLNAAAEKERRSVICMIEIMIRDYCGRNRIRKSSTPGPNP